MDARLWKRTIIYGLIATVLLGILAAATFRIRPGHVERQQVQVVILGDSIMGNTRDDTAIPAQLEKVLGKSVFNSAFGGTCVGRIDREYRLTNTGDSLSLVGLTKAMAADDFGVQQTLRTHDSASVYFESTIDMLETLEFSEVELIVIMYGLNDYYSGMPIYNEEDPLDEYSFTGALRKSLLYLRKVNPDMRILLVSTTYNWNIIEELTCEEYVTEYGIQEDYVRAEAGIAEEMGVEFLDLYHDVYPHEKWDDWKIYTFDGLHPNEAGRQLLADIICEYLQKNP